MQPKTRHALECFRAFRRRYTPAESGHDPPCPRSRSPVTRPHKEGIGFSIELRAFPLDGRLVVLPPDTDEGNSRNGK
jgi:hypothetical protein